jgi:hypothetical protein
MHAPTFFAHVDCIVGLDGDMLVLQYQGPLGIHRPRLSIENLAQFRRDG